MRNFQDIFPGLSTTLNFNFQDFPGPKCFSRTFQVLEFSRKIILDFPGGMGTLQDSPRTRPTFSSSSNLLAQTVRQSLQMSQAMNSMGGSYPLTQESGAWGHSHDVCRYDRPSIAEELVQHKCYFTTAQLTQVSPEIQGG